MWPHAMEGARRLVHLLWPCRCAGCGALVPDGVAFCEACVPSVLPLGTACPGCAMPAAQGGPCLTCARGRFPFASATAVLAYGGAVTEALLRFKHGRVRAHGPLLGAFLAPSLVRALTGAGDETVVLPVPLHPRRLRARGFNQALDLARAGLARARGQAGWPGRGVSLACDGLVRVRDTDRLGHGSPAARRQALAGAFAVPRPSRVRGRRVLLVDDVLTTGATAAEATRTLLAAGATDVRVIALARAT